MKLTLKPHDDRTQFCGHRPIQLLQSFWAAQDGNIAMLAGLVAPVLLLALGGGLSFADASSRRTNLQDSLDAAVLAGAGFAGDDTDKVRVATAYFAGNRSGGITEAEAEFRVEGRRVIGRARLTMPTILPTFMGQDGLSLSVDSAAEESSIPVCLLGLNNLANGAFDINGNPDFSAPDCAVQANSNGSRAMTQEGRAPAHAGLFAVRGGASTNAFSPAPQEGRESVPDPFADIPFLRHDACPESKGSGGRGLVVSESVTLRPGTYCGGINITGRGVKVTLIPGEYVMVDGPLLVNGNAELVGEEVVIGFTGDDSTLRVWGNAAVNLTSPTAGTYENMQFFQDRRDPKGRGAWVSIGGNGGPNTTSDQSKLQIDGAAYFPTQNFWVYGNAEVAINSPGLSVVADKIWFQGSATVRVTIENRRNIEDYIRTGVAFGARLIQ